MVELLSVPTANRTSIRLSFEAFDAALLLQTQNQVRESLRMGAIARPLAVRYQVSLRQVVNNQRRVVLRRTVRSNSVLVRRLASGLYVAKYRAMIVRRRQNGEGQGREQVMHRTHFSPALAFSL
jgi:hypothetical protein